MKRIAVIVTARASWSKLQPVCEALRGRCELQIIVCASALLERYGRTDLVIKSQGFEIAAECWTVHEGENLLTSALETGALLAQLSSVLSRLSPNVVVVCADRHEVLAAAQAGAYSHVPVAHLQGGEVSGSIDDKVRNAVTMLADVHFPATMHAATRVAAMTSLNGRPGSICLAGCPSIDMALRAQHEPIVTVTELGGAGASAQLSHPIVVLQHPVTSETHDAEAQMVATLDAVTSQPNFQTPIVFWPGEDAGAGAMSKALRRYQTRVHTVRNLPPSRFLRLLTQAAVLVGNSSAGIRECSALGVPVVNIGSRQMNRERGPNVIDVPHDAQAIAQAIRSQVAHGKYEPSSLYGSGDSGEKIAKVLLAG